MFLQEQIRKHRHMTHPRKNLPIRISSPSITKSEKRTSVQINVSGVDVFQYDGGLFNLLETISSSIKAGNNPADQLKNIDDQIDNVLTLRSDLGARMNRMDLSSSLLDGLEQSTDNLMSNEVNVDIAKAYTEFAEQQSVYTAALQVGAKIIQPSLVDFLR